jgi:hypothetical protein
MSLVAPSVIRRYHDVIVKGQPFFLYHQNSNSVGSLELSDTVKTVSSVKGRLFLSLLAEPKSFSFLTNSFYLVGVRLSPLLSLEKLDDLLGSNAYFFCFSVERFLLNKQQARRFLFFYNKLKSGNLLDRTLFVPYYLFFRFFSSFLIGFFRVINAHHKSVA